MDDLTILCIYFAQSKKDIAKILNVFVPVSAYIHSAVYRLKKLSGEYNFQQRFNQIPYNTFQYIF